MFNHALICTVTTYLFPTHLAEYVNITGYYLVITEEPMSTCDGVQHLVGCRCNYLDSVCVCVCVCSGSLCTKDSRFTYRQ